MPDPDLQPQNPHPAEWQRDLNPDFLAGQNFTVGNPNGGQAWPTAYDNKALHRELSEQFDDDLLKQIPIAPVGTRLEQGATYLDLRSQPYAPFTATADMEAGPRNAYVPKDQVDYVLWNRLIGVRDPARLRGQA